MSGRGTAAWSALPGAAQTLGEAILIAACCSLVALAVNALRPDGLPLIAERDYEILVPCPEPGGDVTAIAPSDPLLDSPSTFVVDARPAAAAEAWTFRQAMNVPYDYLDPTPEGVLREVARAIAASRARHLAVYGDGDDPDTGELLAKEISASGIKNVLFVEGGAPALEDHLTRGSGR